MKQVAFIASLFGVADLAEQECKVLHSWHSSQIFAAQL
jgi:hypothetical protein